jgi:hypothetical protein
MLSDFSTILASGIWIHTLILINFSGDEKVSWRLPESSDETCQKLSEQKEYLSRCHSSCSTLCMQITMELGFIHGFSKHKFEIQLAGRNYQSRVYDSFNQRRKSLWTKTGPYFGWNNNSDFRVCLQQQKTRLV